MITRLKSVTFIGISAISVDVEVFIASGIPGIMIVGLPDTSTKEAKDRVKAAIKNSAFEYPLRKITINLAPADIRKAGSTFDLPFAVGILISARLLKCKINLEDYIIAGELSLNGKLNKVNGIIALGILAKKLNKTIIIPDENNETAKFLGVKFKSFGTLGDVCKFISGENKEIINTDIKNNNNEADFIDSNCNHNDEYFNFYIKEKEAKKNKNADYPDFLDIKGHELAKRALEIAVSGRHNILMVGPPGSGKSMMAKSAIGILPDISLEESIETSNICSFSNKKLKEDTLILRRPFISVHHSITTVGLIGGGGANPVPGDISLAHNGVLFIDELSELSKKTLDSLRQPMEDKVINLSRSRFSVLFPCNFMLIAAMNPCPCGYYGDEKHQCRCSSADIYKFYNKLSGPILDRFDLFMEVYSVNFEKLMGDKTGESSEEVKKRIARTIRFQNERNFNTDAKLNGVSNNPLNMSVIWKNINVPDTTINFYNEICRKLNISARAYHRTLKVARTIADMEGKDALDEDSILEALNYRNTKFFKF